MKKLVHRILLFVVFTAIGQLVKAQNIGVNNNNPATSLDVNGAISTREGAALALSAGANNNINISTFGFFRITGPTAPFNLTGFNGGANGRLLIVINNTSQAMTINANDAGSASANQIQTPNGQDLVIPQSGTATLQYNATNSKWYVISSQTEPNYWSLSGSNLFNNAGTNIGIGLNSPTNKLHISGVNPVRIETLSGGTTTDSVMTIDPSGVVRRRSVSSIAAQILGGFTANNGLTKVGTNIKIGGTLVENTNIDLGAYNFSLTSGSTGQVGIGTNTPTNRLHISDASNPLRLEGLVGGVAADSIVTANGTGVIRRRTLSDVLAGGNTTFWRTVGNAGTNPASNFIGTTDAQPLVFKTSGTETGRFLANGNLGLGNTTGTNRLHVTAVSDPVRFEGISAGAIADSLITTDATGVLRKRTVSSVVGNAFTADNGLTKTGNNVQFGGTLLQNTTVNQGAFTLSYGGTSNLGMGNTAPSNRLHVTAASDPVRFEGVVGGVAADSLVTVDATGVLRKRTVLSVVAGGFTANNGLTKVGNNVEMGGALLKNTDIAMSGFDITHSGTGNLSVGNAAPTNKLHVTAASNPVRFEGIAAGAIADSLITTDATGVLRKRTVSSVVGNAFTADNGLTKTGNNVELGGTLLKNTTVDQSTFNMVYSGTGNFGIGTASPAQKLDVTGNIAVAGNIFTSSDIRFKKNVTTLSGSLDKLMKLRGTEYDWKIKEFPAKNFDSRHQIGFIAQELEKVFPELVTTGKDGYKSVDYTHIVPVLVEAMKEQQKMIEQLKTENSTLTASKTQNDAKVEDLSKQMSALTDMVKSLLSKESSATKAMSEK